MALSRNIKIWGLFKTIKNDVIVLYYAWKHPETPPLVKGLLLALLVYVFSPVDVIPDYWPIIGIVDDIAFIPVVILFLINMLPTSVRRECEAASFKWRKRMPWVFGLFMAFLLIWFIVAIVGISRLIAYIT